MISYQLEKWNAFAKDFEHIWLTEHRAEVQGPDSTAILNMAMYAAHEEDLNLVVITARDEDKLVGYVVTILVFDLPFLGNQTANVAFYYVLQSYRKQGIGSKLFELAENYLPALGVDGIYVSAKTSLPYADYLRNRNYKEQELTLYRRL